jgi:hypothetical protein
VDEEIAATLAVEIERQKLGNSPARIARSQQEA